jgi:hypothetical protein
MRHAARTLATLVAIGTLAACETQPTAPPAPPTQSIVALYQQPAERALINGMRQYEDGSFERSEVLFRAALEKGLADPRDQATARKYLAFLACAFNRLAECEQQFRDAFAADPRFALSDVEIGHPVWGPIYRKVRDAGATASKKP